MRRFALAALSAMALVHPATAQVSTSGLSETVAPATASGSAALPAAALVFSGRANQNAALPVRIADPGTIRIDGVLDEPAWQSAALLTGFSEYTPTDGLPAEDSTEVLVWYSETVMYFGI